MRFYDDEIFGDPEISPEAFISSRAVIIGEVYVEKNVIIKAGSSIDADEGGPFRIQKGTNIQEGVVFHGLLNQYVDVSGQLYSIWVGSHCSIAHRALIHGPARIGKMTFVGFDAIVHKSTVGRNCYIGFKTIVKGSLVGDHCYIGDGAQVEGVRIPYGRYVANGLIISSQRAADELPLVPHDIAEKANEFNKEVVDFNNNLVMLYKARRKSRKSGVLRRFFRRMFV